MEEGSGGGGSGSRQQTPMTLQHSIPLEILDDLGSRFIINVPEDQRKDLIRMCFCIEIAHWFYIDEYVMNKEKANAYKPKLKQCWLREFAEHMFRHIGFLRCHADNVDQILDDFKAYKLAVPTYGGIILNQDMSKVLLVLGYWSKTSWGFPKGKVNEDEPPHLCAVREVLEETGFDMSQKIDPDEFIAKEIHGQRCCLYMIGGVSEETHFAPRTKREIKDIKWFPVAGLPTSKKEEAAASVLSDPVLNPFNVTTNNLFMVIPFVVEIRKWIANQNRKQQRHHRGGGNRNSFSAKNNNQRKSFRESHSENHTDNHHHQHQHHHHQKKNSFRESEETTTTTPSVAISSSAPPPPPPPELTDDFVPKAWSNFRIKKRSLIASIESTPGWIK